MEYLNKYGGDVICFRITKAQLVDELGCAEAKSRLRRFLYDLHDVKGPPMPDLTSAIETAFPGCEFTFQSLYTTSNLPRVPGTQKYDITQHNTRTEAGFFH